VASGDTLHRIALKFKTSTDYLVHLNALERADHVFLGQKLKVPETDD
jgi:LysM repeat protein